MNTMPKMLQFDVEPTEDLCPTHLKPLIQIGFQKLCKICAEETIQRSQMDYERGLQQRLLEQKIKNSGLNKRYLQCGFKNYMITHKAQKNVVELCQHFAQQITLNEKPNLLLVGSPGTGKTHLSASIIRNILHHSQYSARYYTSAEIAQKMMDTWSDSALSERELLNHFSSFDLLAIDEYGLHDRHEKRMEMVHKVLYTRYDNMKPTILISNFSLTMMEKDLGSRLWSRLHENGLVVTQCYWNDQRVTE